MSPFRKAPVTAECIIVCTALFVICHAQGWDGTRFRDSQRQWGAALALQVVPLDDNPPEAIHRQLQGPFDLWDGEWWRIPISAFHHGDFLHLLFNSFAAWSLGWRLERRWGSWRYALFLVPAIVIPLMLEVLFGNTAIGFSGATCAMLGALIVDQKVKPRDTDLPDEAILVMLGLLLLAIPATVFDIVQVANVAHVSGVCYGWLAASCCSGPRSNWILRTGFVTSHLLLIPGLWLAIHPMYNGRYLWYLADRDRRISPLEREPLLKTAVKLDPSLTGVWLRLANYRMIEGNPQAAWTVLIEALALNPADEDLCEGVRRVWRRLPFGSERDAAEAEVRRVFGDRAPDWIRLIRNTRLIAKSPPRVSTEQTLDPKLFPLDRSVNLHWKPHHPAHEPPVVDPDRPDSALEGTAL
ncbi:MAG: rhomboid family intramembrane serine protease [Planctomycetes bacterium]|nr:rhomboid family intramembrane serine protease [Planctomycetota bacterium]